MLLAASGIRAGVRMGWYALAKLLELGDEAVFHATVETVSGHSLKHVAAAPVLGAVSRHRLRQNAAGFDATASTGTHP